MAQVLMARTFVKEDRWWVTVQNTAGVLPLAQQRAVLPETMLTRAAAVVKRRHREEMRHFTCAAFCLQ
jgi:hypothetical protein